METQQDTPMTMPKVELRKEHEWLQILVGEWTMDDSAAMSSGQPGCVWTESVRSLHGVWILGEGRGEMPGGGAATTMLTLGYDPQKERFVGTWLGSMMTHLWIYEGTLDEAGKVLTLNSEGPDMTTPGKMSKYRDVIELKSNDHRVLTSQMLGEDGEWREFMTAHYRRTK
jgi:hypothetical protein